MPKYFFDPNQLQGDTITLDCDTAHHLIHVLRVAPGELIVLCDGAETDYFAKIELVNSKKTFVVCKITEHVPCLTEPETRVTLYQGLPKGDKLDIIIQKCVELGIAGIVPVETARSVVRIKKEAKKTVRHQRIAMSAASQSMRGIIPTVGNAVTLKDALLHQNSAHLTLVAYEEETRSLKSALKEHASPSHINIWVGPEGGFEKEEIVALTSQGAIPVSLGKRILRTETAAISMLAQVLCLVE